MIGADGIVTDAHLPAYRLAGFPVAGTFDLDGEKARRTGQAWGIPFFAGSMANLQRVNADEDEDAWHTMRCFRSSSAPGTPVPGKPETSA
jgi:predicted dehydrogenase